MNAKDIHKSLFVGSDERVAKKRTLATFATQQIGETTPDPNNVRVRFDATLSATFTGPIVHLSDMKMQAVQLMAQELYGEIRDELWHLRKALYEEDYRPSDDPVLASLRRIEELCTP